MSLRISSGGAGNPPRGPSDHPLDTLLKSLAFDRKHITKKGAASFKDIQEERSTTEDFLKYCENHTIADVYSKVAEQYVLRKAIVESIKTRAPARVERIKQVRQRIEFLQEEEKQALHEAKASSSFKKKRGISDMAWLAVGFLGSLFIGIGQVYLLLQTHESPFMETGNPLAGAASWPFGIFIVTAAFDYAFRQRFPNPRHHHNLTLFISSVGILAASVGLFFFSHNFGWLGAEVQHPEDGQWLTAAFLSLDAIAGELTFSALMRTYLAWRNEDDEDSAKAEEAARQISTARKSQIEQERASLTADKEEEENDGVLLVWAQGGLDRIEATARTLANRAIAHGQSVIGKYHDFNEE